MYDNFFFSLCKCRNETLQLCLTKSLQMQTKKLLIKNNCLCGKIRGERGVETHLKPMKIGFKCERAVQIVIDTASGFLSNFETHSISRCLRL